MGLDTLLQVPAEPWVPFHLSHAVILWLFKFICSAPCIGRYVWKALWSFETHHSNLRPYLPRFSKFQKTQKKTHNKNRQNSSGDRNISYTHHALFTANSFRQIASATLFFTCNESNCLQIAQFLTKWIHLLLKCRLIIFSFLRACYFKLPCIYLYTFEMPSERFLSVYWFADTRRSTLQHWSMTCHLDSFSAW